jgi:O6-methylguanine-DNA--protein-cysteine methyltransferase
LQGRYLALVRRIPAGKRARFGQIAKEKGREAAIRAMQSEVGSSKPAATAGGGKRRRRTAKLSSEQLASRQLQGRYLGLIRQIPASQRARFKKIVKDKGREAAIKELQSAVK